VNPDLHTLKAAMNYATSIDASHSLFLLPIEIAYDEERLS